MSSLHLRSLVFVSGLTVMAVEMTALRLLAPYFGTSLVVTTILIGSMMGFLSLGYWLGGRYADRYPSITSLSRVTGVAAIWVAVVPFIGHPILNAAAATMRPLLSGQTLDEPTMAFAMIAGGLLGVLALLALPVTLMGMTSPWAVRLAVDKVADAGKAAGGLYAVSTFGSILGSFLPALLLIPRLGVQDTFITLGILLAAISAVGAFRKPAMAAAALVLAPAYLVPRDSIRPMEGMVTETESLYHFIQVVVEPFGKCPEANHLYLNEGVAIHSVKCLDPNIETRGFWSYMAAAPLYRDEPETTRDVLMIGLAGGTIPRQLLEAFPEAHVDGVEIDGEVVAMGERYFDNADPRITPFVMDGRVYLQSVDKRYDVILVDAYRQPYIPFHLTTVEFWTEVREHMNDDGVVALNVASARGVSDELVRRMYATLREVFPAVHYVDATSSNDILYALNTDKDPMVAAQHLDEMPSVKGLDQLRGVLRRKTQGPVEGWEGAIILTDDQAPVEMIWDLMALQFAS